MDMMNNGDKGMMGMGKVCRCPHHKTIPVLIVIFALLFLLHAMGNLSDHALSLGWPIVLGLAGLFKIFAGGCKCCGNPHRW